MTPTPDWTLDDMAALLNPYAQAQGFEVVVDNDGDPDGPSRWLAALTPTHRQVGEDEWEPDVDVEPLDEMEDPCDFLLGVIAALDAEVRALRTHADLTPSTLKSHAPSPLKSHEVWCDGCKLVRFRFITSGPPTDPLLPEGWTQDEMEGQAFIFCPACSQEDPQ